MWSSYTHHYDKQAYNSTKGATSTNATIIKLNQLLETKMKTNEISILDLIFGTLRGMGKGGGCPDLFKYLKEVFNPQIKDTV